MDFQLAVRVFTENPKPGTAPANHPRQEDHHRSLPVAMRQLIVDLKAEYADFTDGEIAAICAIQFSGRRPSHHTVKAVLADSPPHTVRYQLDKKHFKAIPEARRFETPYSSLQGRLWELDETSGILPSRFLTTLLERNAKKSLCQYNYHC